jgi:hypothetical protein
LMVRHKSERGPKVSQWLGPCAGDRLHKGAARASPGADWACMTWPKAARRTALTSVRMLRAASAGTSTAVYMYMSEIGKKDANPETKKRLNYALNPNNEPSSFDTTVDSKPVASAESRSTQVRLFMTSVCLFTGARFRALAAHHVCIRAVFFTPTTNTCSTATVFHYRHRSAADSTNAWAVSTPPDSPLAIGTSTWVVNPPPVWRPLYPD